MAMLFRSAPPTTLMNNAKVSLGGHRSDVAGNPRKIRLQKLPTKAGARGELSPIKYLNQILCQIGDKKKFREVCFKTADDDRLSTALLAEIIISRLSHQRPSLRF